MRATALFHSQRKRRRSRTAWHADRPDGSGVDPNDTNWNPSIIQQRQDEIVDSLDWWEETFDVANPNSPHDLQFETDFTNFATPFQTQYEPTLHLYSERNDLWVAEYLNTVGASSVREWNAMQRIAHGADWAFTIFVVNGGDGVFNDRPSRGLAMFGGPEYHFIPTSSPGFNGSLITPHETGHIFYATDEYDSTSLPSHYNYTSGYYGAQNLNAIHANPDPNFVQEPSIMAGGLPAIESLTTHMLPESTREHLG